MGGAIYTDDYSRPPNRPRPNLIVNAKPQYHVPIGEAFSTDDLKKNQFAVIRPEVNADSIEPQTEEVQKRKDFKEFKKKLKCWLEALPKCRDIVVKYKDYDKFQYNSLYMWNKNMELDNTLDQSTWTNITSTLENGCSGFQKPCSELSNACDALAFTNCQIALDVVYWRVTGNYSLGPWNDSIIYPTFKSHAPDLNPNNLPIFGLLALFLLFQLFKF